MIEIASLKIHVRNLFAGLVDSLGEISPKVEITRAPDGKSALALVRDGYDVERFSGPQTRRRLHQIEDCASLAAWLLRHADPQTTEILASNDAITAALQPDAAIGDVVHVPLAAHPRFERWAKLFGELPKISQRALHRHVLACADDFPLRSIEGGGNVGEGELFASQLAKFNAVRASEVSCEVDELGYVRFAATSDKTTVSGRLPPKIRIQVPIFLGVEKGGAEPLYDLDLFLAVEPAEKGPPAFGLTCPELEVVRRRARLDVVEHLRDLLAGTEFLVGLGRYTTEIVTGEIPA